MSDEGNIVQRIVDALDCCGTCAGGVLAAHVRQTKAEALREAAADQGGRLSGHSGVSVRWLRARADDFHTPTDHRARKEATRKTEPEESA